MPFRTFGKSFACKGRLEARIRQGNKYPKLGHFASCVPFGEARALSSETEPREMGKELAFLETRHDLRRYP